MSQDDIVKLLRAQPFRPFRLRMANDQTYDVPHPDMAIASPWTIHVGILKTTNSQMPAAQEVVILSMNHVLSVDFLPAPTPSSSNGSAK